MLWAAAMGIKVGGLSRTVAQPRPHADRLPNEDSSCDSRHECVPRATTRPPLACTVCSTRVRAGIRAKFSTIMLGISSTRLISCESWFIFFFRKKFSSIEYLGFLNDTIRLSWRRYFCYDFVTLGNVWIYNVCVSKVFQFRIYSMMNWEDEIQNRQDARRRRGEYYIFLNLKFWN